MNDSQQLIYANKFIPMFEFLHVLIQLTHITFPDYKYQFLFKLQHLSFQFQFMFEHLYFPTQSMILCLLKMEFSLM